MVHTALSAALAVTLLVQRCLTVSPPIKVSMQSSWKAPSALLELIETVAMDEPEAFFPLLDVLTDPEVVSPRTSRSPEALEQLVLHSAVSLGYLSKPMAQELTRMQLALHSASPTLEAFYQHYVDTAQHLGARRDAKSCGSWVYWYGEVVCDADRLLELTSHETIEETEEAVVHSETFERPQLLPFDHVYPSPERALTSPPRTAILFASLSSTNFRELHSNLLSLSTSNPPKIEYVFRPIPDDKRENHTPLSGYGVTLDLKKTDYLVIDDRLSNREASADNDETDQPVTEDGTVPDVDLVLSVLEQYDVLNESVKLTDPLTEDELMRLGLQATHLVMESDEPLIALKQLSQDFPRYASSLARRIVPSDNVTEEATINSMRFQGGNAVVWMNGAVIPPDRMNPYSLIRLLRKEEDVMLSLTSLGLSPNASFELIAHPMVDAPYTGSDILEGIFDASDREEHGGLITWLNDLETDLRYARWGTSLFGILQPQYPGQAPGVRLNLLNVVVVLDLSTARSVYFLASTVNSLIQRGLPIRFGVVPFADKVESVQIAQIISYLLENYDLLRAANFMKQILSFVKEEADLNQVINMAHARAVFDGLNLEETLTENGERRTWDEVFGAENEDTSTLADKAREYARRLDIDLGSSPRGHAFVNGRHYDVNDQFLGMLQMDINKFMQYFQELLYNNLITDDSFDDISVWFYDLPTSYKRRNHFIIPSGNPSDVRIYSLSSLFDQTGFNIAPGAFVYPDDNRVPSSMHVIADFDTEEGFAMAQNAASFKVRSRVSFIHNPTFHKDPSGPGLSMSKVLAHLVENEKLQAISPAKLLHALKLHVPGEDHPEQHVLKAEETLEEVLGGIRVDQIDTNLYSSYVVASAFVVGKLRIQRGDSAVLMNGRLVGPLSPLNMMPADFEALEHYEFQKRVQPVLDVIEIVQPGTTSLDDAAFTSLISTAVSIVSDVRIPDPSEASLYNAPLSSRNAQYRKLGSEHTMFKFGDENTALVRFGIALDPLSEAAQKYSSLLEWLSTLPLVYAEVHLVPAPYAEMPLKRFYRYNLRPKLTYNEAGDEVLPHSVFAGLPTEPIYTLGLDEPPSWLVRPRVALYDLDNIQLGRLSGSERQNGVEVLYELDFLVVDGHARESATTRPPRGVQLQLSDSHGAVADTLVMDNLGYLQFKATPGVYALEVRAGRGHEIYTVESVGNEGWNSPNVEEDGGFVTVTSFEGLTMYPRLARRPGMERADVLAETAREESIVDSVVSSISSFFGGKKESKEVEKPPSRHADINIFTVASGMLYERFASIMILSVLRNTNHSVKFWFIENFLSPAFLEFIPQFAQEYNFQYEFVTYKWPKWLRAQREKQRIIWAYKILFLDVLFPMDLERVIFVDADQIVRADLHELVTLDLHGAPYAYTPMGDDNTEMEGFRFWKHGYWNQTLRGKPYHISALYVIDLNRFRQFAAGDILRTHYHELSADPGSLANLDQDLPNNLQTYVPIYSLHEDWLWCETWCSKDRLDRAKTIDLCQNPLTKEPKLARARQIPEWSVYDAEIATFARRLADEGRIHASAAAADVNQLAAAAGGKAGAVEDAGADEEGVHDGETTGADDGEATGENGKAAPDAREKIHDEL